MHFELSRSISLKGAFLPLGKVDRVIDCNYWMLGLDSSDQTQDYKAFGIKLKNSDLPGVPAIVPIITRDLIR